MARCRTPSAFLFALAVFGCLPTAAGCGAKGAESAAAERPGRALTPEELDVIAHQVSIARELPAKRPVAIELVAPKDFTALVRSGLAGEGDAPAAGALGETEAFLLGFNFVPRPEERSGISGVDEVLTEEIVGFYDADLDRVFVPVIVMRDEYEYLKQRAVVAHEVHHALQAQHFGDVPPKDLPNEDAQLAALALAEGDAMVAMGAYLGLEHGAPVRRTLRRITDVTKEVPLSRLAHRDPTSAIERAILLTQRRLLFPYQDGMVFVSDIHRAGGFALVDSLYARPPASTEHILHPERYVAGDMPRAIATPTAPPGARIVSEGVLGELQLRTLLEGCLDAGLAARAAEGWGGDRYAVTTDDRSRIVTLYTSVWDTEDDAREIEAALGVAKDCFHDNRLGGPARDFAVTADLELRREGDRVAFVRGLPSGEAVPLLAQWIAQPAAPAERTPLEGVTIPPRRPLPEPRLGAVDVDVYRSDWLGIVGRVPTGMTWATGENDAELWVRRPDILVLGGLFLSDRITTRPQNERAFAEVRWAFAQHAHMAGTDVIPITGGDIQTPLGPAEERTWQVLGTTVIVRMILVPICAGTGSLIFLQASEDDYARAVLDGWLASFRFTSGRDLPVCERLDPK